MDEVAACKNCTASVEIDDERCYYCGTIIGKNQTTMNEKLNNAYQQAAFPAQYPLSEESGFGTDFGMTLLDYFAGQILASGVLDGDDGLTIGDCAEFLGVTVVEYDFRKHWPIYRAKKAYEAAKAMMEARKEIYE